jgi:streptogramin lyase
MATETTDYQFNTPVVGTEEDNWGTLLNENFQQIENCFNGTTEVAPNLAAGFWKVDDFAVTSTAAELNKLDGFTGDKDDLNLLDGAAPNTVVNNKAVVYGSAGQVQATTVDLGNWTVTESSGVLYFATGGTNKMKLDASGNLTVVGDISAYGTI